MGKRILKGVIVLLVLLLIGGVFIPVFNLSKKKSCVKKEKTGRINQSSLSKEIVLLSKKRLFNGTENLLQTLSRRSLDRARLR